MKGITLRAINLGKRSFIDSLRTQDLCRQLMIQQSLTKNNSQSLLQSMLSNKWSEHADEYPTDGIILLVEHWPVYTAGLRNNALTKADECKLRLTGAEVYRTNRGGLVTFHGPGQLVAYPIIDLRLHKLGLRRYVEKLEVVLMETCKRFNVTAQTTQNTGVWVEDRKIASIGVNAKRHVTLHGVALNCCTDLTWFEHITPCGLEGVHMTSLSKETSAHISVSEAIIPFLQAFRNHFNCHIFTESDYVGAKAEFTC